jgi:hypothetical protein
LRPGLLEEEMRNFGPQQLTRRRKIAVASAAIIAVVVGVTVVAALRRHPTAPAAQRASRLSETVPSNSNSSPASPDASPLPSEAIGISPATNRQDSSQDARRLVDQLRFAAAAGGEITPELADAIRQNLIALSQQGRAAIPVLWEFLARGEDVRFDADTPPNPLGEPTLRIALLKILPELPEPENLQIQEKLLRTASDRDEIALLARQLRLQDPAKYADVIVRTVRSSLLKAQNEQSPPEQLAPLTEILSLYGVEEIPAAIAPDADGVLCTGQIGGSVWLDDNGDGVQDVAERGLPAIGVVLYDGNDGFRHDVVTDGAGWYQFSGLCAGSYKVYVEPATLAGYQPTIAGVGDPSTDSNALPAAIILRSADQTAGSIDFGFKSAGSPTPGPTLSAVVLQKPSESPLPATSPSAAGVPPRRLAISYSAREWAARPSGDNAGMLLQNDFAAVYERGYAQIGGERFAKFESADAIRRFLPAAGPVAGLTADHVDPAPEALPNSFASQVLALRLNVDFSRAGKLPPDLGARKLKTTKLKDWTVFDVLSLANLVLGGGSPAVSLSVAEISAAVTAINENFAAGEDMGTLAP